MRRQQDRRSFMATATAATMSVGLPHNVVLGAAPGLETTSIRLKQSSAICFAPYYVAEAFLRAEGFEDVQYVAADDDALTKAMLANGELNFDLTFAGQIIHDLDQGEELSAVGGMHVGCYELFAREPISTITDLKGKRVGISGKHLGEHLYISIMAAYVGLDPLHDIEWVTGEEGPPLELFAEGKTDAFLGFPPEPQMLRARGFNRVILNTVQDHPWSQYFCCVMFGNRTWVRDHPVATKSFLRAMYKSAEFCTESPTNAAQYLADGGFAERYDYALETIEAVPYDLWHEFDAEDTMRFYALRLYDAGMLKTPPNKLIAEGTDWRFLNALKREMKA